MSVDRIQSQDHQSKKTRVTCLTCKLKRCVGRCDFKVVDSARPPKAA